MIEVKHLTKMYGNHLAVDDLSFTVLDGQIYGFLGPNGAGKSTTMNVMTGYLSATGGEVLINGIDIFESPEEAKRLIGYLPENPPVYPDMTPREYLEFVCELKGVARDKWSAQIDAAMESTGIVHVQNRLIKQLSKGYRQRVGFAQAMLGEPAVIILDEPTVGLDPVQIIEIRDLIKKLGEKHTVILSSHILSEVSAVCDHVLIISHGRLVASDTPENLARLMRGRNSYTFTLSGARSDVEKALAGVKGVAKTEFSDCDEGVRVILETDEERDPRSDCFYALAKAKCPILALSSELFSLEDVFIEVTAGDARSDKEDTDEGNI